MLFPVRPVLRQAQDERMCTQKRMARVEALQEMQGKQLDRLENKVDGLQKQVLIGAGVVIGAVAVIQIAIALLT